MGVNLFEADRYVHSNACLFAIPQFHCSIDSAHFHRSVLQADSKLLTKNIIDAHTSLATENFALPGLYTAEVIVEFLPCHL